MDDDTLQFFLERANRTAPKRLVTIPKRAVSTAKLTKNTRQGNAYKHTRTGFRPDLGITVRSGWEANVLRVLTSYDIHFEFEPYVFVYPVKRGVRAYIPDIFLPDTGEYIEIKGYFDDRSRLKIKRFKKYYPEEFSLLTLIIGKNSALARETCAALGVPNVLFYEDISHLFKEQITNWE